MGIKCDDVLHAHVHQLLKGRKVARRVRAIIIPATQHVYKECIRLGYMDTFRRCELL